MHLTSIKLHRVVNASVNRSGVFTTFRKERKASAYTASYILYWQFRLIDLPHIYENFKILST